MLLARFDELVSAATAPTDTPLIVRSPAVIAPKVDAAAPVTCARLYEPSVELLALPMLLTVIVSPTLAPIWNAALLKLPSSSLTPLNEVVDEMRSISAFSACASVLSAARSGPEFVALRSAERRGGKEVVITCSSCWATLS